MDTAPHMHHVHLRAEEYQEALAKVQNPRPVTIPMPSYDEHPWVKAAEEEKVLGPPPAW